MIPKIMSKTVAFAMVAMLMLAFVPAPALAASPAITLHDTGDASSYSYRVAVYANRTLAISDDDYEIAVSVAPFAATVTDNLIDGWFLLVKINDGVLNKTVANFTLDSENDTTTWDSIDVYMGDFVANTSAVMSISLINQTGVEKDSEYLTVAIYTNQAEGAIHSFIPVVVAIAIIGALVGILKRYKK